MIDVHFSQTANTVFIDEGTRTTAIELPSGLDPAEVAQVLQSKTLTAIVAALVGKEQTK